MIKLASFPGVALAATLGLAGVRGASADPLAEIEARNIEVGRKVNGTAGAPLYDPAAITWPTLLVSAEWDVDVRFDMAHDLFVRLAGASYQRLVEIGQATHMVLMERDRQQAFDAVVAFVDERFVPPA